MDDSPLTDAERRFLLELVRRGVEFAVVGMSAALLQGARGATEDVDLWFRDPSDPRISEAARDRIDVVTHMHGLGSFASEVPGLTSARIDDELALPVLPLERILISKRAAGRPKDLAQIPALETALAVLAAT